MIPIIIHDKNIVKQYAKDILFFIANNTQGKKENLKAISKAILFLSNHTFTFYDVLVMEKDELEKKVKPLYEKYKLSFSIKQKDEMERLLHIPIKKRTKEEKEDLRYLKNITLYNLKDIYKSFFDKNGLKFMTNIGIKVCPYCNRNYIYNAKTARSSEIDHFFPKDDYPIFALSFYNLIPSCRTCNHIKSDNIYPDLISPYDRSLKNDTFIFEAKPVSYGKFSLILKANNSQAFHSVKILNEKLQLKELYEYHSYIPNELYQKMLLISEDYIDLLKKSFIHRQLGTESDFRRLILSNYGEDNDYLLRTLSKATKDCAVQFGLYQKI